MRTFEFTIVIPDVDDDMIAGRCPDSGVGTCAAETFVDFDRNAKSLGEAVDSAIADLGVLGIAPIRVTIDMPQPAVS